MYDEEQEQDRHFNDHGQVPVLLLAGVDDDPAESHIIRSID
ncbi:hypothetical protein OHA71_05915 [Streptomyces sp. NBC_00444]